MTFFRPLLQLTKPGIVAGNMISVTGGYLLASRGDIDWWQGFLVAMSVALAIASGCVINNIVDRDIDHLMERTQNRALVTGRVAVHVALVYGLLMGVLGFGVLYFATESTLSVLLLLIGYVVYVGLYTLCLKRNSIHGTFVGSISGAMPPVVGYCAASGQFDAAAITLLVMFSLWQMPHSYAIAIFRAADYRAASIPVLPVVKGFAVARWHIACYIVAFTAAALTLGILGYAGGLFMSVAFACGAFWLRQSLAGWKSSNESKWARKIFFTSIVIVTALSIAMSLDYYRPVSLVAFQGQ